MSLFLLRVGGSEKICIYINHPLKLLKYYTAFFIVQKFLHKLHKIVHAFYEEDPIAETSVTLISYFYELQYRLLSASRSVTALIIKTRVVMPRHILLIVTYFTR